MSLKDQLIKLGYEKPELRDNLRPILATLDKAAHSGHSDSLHTPSGTWGAAHTPDLAALAWFGYAVAPAGIRNKAEKLERAKDITLREVLRHTERQTDDVTIEYLERNFEEVRSRYLSVEERR
jgi:hypothetical protein